MPFRYRTAFLLSRIGNLTILAGMTLLLGGCQAGGSIWKETISLEPKDKTVSEETLDPETDIDGQVESEQVDGAELRVEMQGQDESGKLESEPGENDSNECSLLFAGDIYFSNHVLNAYDRVGGIGGVLGESLRETIAESDIFMANLEFPFSDRGTQAADKQFTFRVSPSRVSILQEIGPDIVTVANNHALDYGTDALLDTCDTLDSAGILHVGAGKNLEEAKQPQIIEKNGKKIGFLGASRVFPTGGWAAGSSHPGMFSAYDTASVVQEIQKVKKECDYLVVYVHNNGKLPVVNFAAGGVATPADAALMMQLGAEGVFVGSGIFKSGNPAKRAAAIVKAVTNYTDAKLIAELSAGLGEAMVGINEQEIALLMAERGK